MVPLFNGYGTINHSAGRFIHSPDGNTPTKLLSLISQSKLMPTLTLTLNPKSELTLERGTNPTKSGLVFVPTLLTPRKSTHCSYKLNFVFEVRQRRNQEFYFGGAEAHGEREAITGVWGQSPRRGPGAEPLVRGPLGLCPPEADSFSVDVRP